MKVILFGATGMVGQGVLRECLLDSSIESIMAVGRTRLDSSHPKLKQMVLENLYDYASVADAFFDFDACYFCLGAPSAGKSEAEYRRVTFDLTLAAAGILSRAAPEMTFIYVSGAGADSSGAGKTMWARVRGQTENALMKLPFKAVYIFRPGIIQPLYGARSKTRSYRLLYTILSPLLPVLRKAFPRSIATTSELGRAMIGVSKRGFDRQIIGPADFGEAARLAAGE